MQGQESSYALDPPRRPKPSREHYEDDRESLQELKQENSK
jgi:hypothetical protein